ncbi:hypothetical protein ASPWEDRAFT_389648 [Aspergillus wentii DTO 134E9]|uniref:Uncharacterized protein n=1 Tax=Aspergillus wentii DTO 134E9 TaxID=1073089 RepID=A0A1L9RXS0_ASPWE|nr:uncharacterized protein ASPWEDRAFT_389648 [Aspergillus wentii DTO 134E9]OJJ39719.1 hypothetical protein ASPWEDRAFT_389648 [Aspergillus wentii DTO 134E9]
MIHDVRSRLLTYSVRCATNGFFFFFFFFLFPFSFSFLFFSFFFFSSFHFLPLWTENVFLFFFHNLRHAIYVLSFSITLFPSFLDQERVRCIWLKRFILSRQAIPYFFFFLSLCLYFHYSHHHIPFRRALGRRTLGHCKIKGLMSAEIQNQYH